MKRAPYDLDRALSAINASRCRLMETSLAGIKPGPLDFFERKEEMEKIKGSLNGCFLVQNEIGEGECNWMLFNSKKKAEAVMEEGDELFEIVEAKYIGTAKKVISK